jgi:mRNA-degrading endonuclease RelE of RelBE toxin-antitoxin system
MKVYFHKSFIKQHKKLPSKIRKQFGERLTLYLKDQQHPLLRVHTLTGEQHAYQSLNVNADYRALFVATDIEVTFHKIGTHSQLYKK